MLRVLSIFGTRPEAIKMAPVVKALESRPDKFENLICVTGQHRQMLDQVLRLFGIVPDDDLNIMQDNQSLSYLTASVLTKLERVIKNERPDWVLVQGDTTTTMAASLAAFYQQVKVAHIEAGLRTWNKFHPFPEEINRKVADAVADFHFAPTNRAKENLLHEGVPGDSILVTGNTVIDALLQAVSLPFEIKGTPLEEIPLVGKRIILVTAHRRENFGKPLKSICSALKQIAEEYPDDVQIVYPVHLNPNIWKPVHSMLKGIHNISLLEPLDYHPFVNLMSRSHLILTDSGGLQEEAPGLGKPVLVMREATERPEGVQAGTVRVTGVTAARIMDEVNRLLQCKEEYRRMAQAVNPYGDGHASRRIVRTLLGELASPFEPIRI